MLHTKETMREGRLLAAVLILLALISLGVYLNRLPRSVAVEPVSSVSEYLLIDLNSAAAEELANLPGIGAELAARIVAYRAENGPFASVDGLDSVPGIGPGKIDGLRSLVFCG